MLTTKGAEGRREHDRGRPFCQLPPLLSCGSHTFGRQRCGPLVEKHDTQLLIVASRLMGARQSGRGQNRAGEPSPAMTWPTSRGQPPYSPQLQLSRHPRPQGQSKRGSGDISWGYGIVQGRRLAVVLMIQHPIPRRGTEG